MPQPLASLEGGLIICTETNVLDTIYHKADPSRFFGKMLSLGSLRHPRDLARINLLCDQASPIILAGLLAIVDFHNYLLIQQSNGGSDLVSADIPKGLMLLQGQNPYSVQPWASPYPPLLLFIVSGIIRLNDLLSPRSSLDLISQHIRIAGLFVNSAVALIIYLFIRSRTGRGLQALIPSGLFLTLPAISTSPLYFFHSDAFGYPILALSIVALARHRYFIGTTLLATATIFKIHPVLALPLVMVWLVRTQGLRKTLPSLASTTTSVTLGLVLPMGIPGYQQAVIGFNLSNGGDGTTFYTMISLLNGILPQAFQVRPSQLLYNQVWLATTFALYTITLGVVWTRARSLGPIDVAILGLLAWLIPLRIVYTHYVVWAIIPFLMRGQFKQTIVITGLLQVADTIAYWSWWPGNSPIPGMDTLYGSLLASTVYRLVGLSALGFILNALRKNTLGTVPLPTPPI